ncbi:MAG: hypothetical protein ACTSRU_11980 [Candidatus Hodarchaeales archaeon]
MNSNLTVEKTNRSLVFAEWNNMFKILEWLFMVIIILNAILNFFVVNQLWITIADLLLGIGVYCYFEFKIWKRQFRLVWWIGKLDNEVINKNILLCPGNVTTISVFFDVGPNVKRWVLRLSLPRECYFVNIPPNGAYHMKRGRKDSKCCLYNIGNQNQINAVFQIEALRDEYSSPDIHILFESATDDKAKQIERTVSCCQNSLFDKSFSLKCILVPEHLWPP